MAVPVDLGKVETTILAVENATKWRFALPARTTIQQLFVSLAADEGGFKTLMNDEVRQTALFIAHAGLTDFLNRVVNKSAEVAQGSGYTGKDVGFPVVVHEIEAWSTTISCVCWPR